MNRFDASRPTAQTGLTSQTGQIGQIQTPEPISSPGQVDPGQVAHPPVVCPPILPGPVTPGRTLSADELTQVAGVGGAGISGVGTLKGIIDVQDTGRMLRPFLVTANPGSRSEVKFLLDVDVKTAAARKGESLEVTGQIDKQTMYSGKITGAALGEPRGISPGAYRTFSGTVEDLQLFGIGGEAPPSGLYLVLAEPVTVDDKSFDRLFLGWGEQFPEGAEMELHGRVDVGRFGGVEVRDGTYLGLSGVSNVGAGEPKFTVRDGFTTDAGKPAPILILDRRDILDAPNYVMVPDQGQDKAFLGTHGGMRMPGSNPFGGFSGSAPIQPATDADRARIAPDARTGQIVNVETGDALERLSSPAGQRNGRGPDPMATTWYLDKAADTAYRFRNGGMDQVVKLPGQANELPFG